MIKLPLFVSTLVLLLKNINYQQCINELQTIFIVAPHVTSTFKTPSIIQPSITPSSITPISNKDVFNNIFNEQPDF